MILCGDSAGGNLILGLLSHLLHPHPSLPPLALREPLLGAALISPWGVFSTSAPSFTRNEEHDSVNGAILRKWSTYFTGGAPADNYNQPFLAPGSWWSHLNGLVQELLITAGTDEVLLDGIAEFAKTIEVRRVPRILLGDWYKLGKRHLLTYYLYINLTRPSSRTHEWFSALTSSTISLLWSRLMMMTATAEVSRGKF